jgi:hypothetical protein
LGDWQVWAALEQCHCGEAVRAWPGRLDARLAPGSSPPPLHVQQRLCLARAVLAAEVLGAGALVLDDPAGGALDPGGRRLVEDRHVGAGRTVVLTGRSAAAAARMDWVVVMKAGRAVEAGRTGPLLECSGSVFARLVREEEVRAQDIRRLGPEPADGDSGGDDSDDDRPRAAASRSALQLGSAPAAAAGEAAVAAAAAAATAAVGSLGTPVAAAGGLLWSGIKHVARASHRLRRSGTM